MSIDADFRSGVLLGAGMSNLVLSLMPSRVLSIVELFGYKGDREVGLRMLYEAGGWSKEKDGPSVSAEEEGVRRSICDMVLLIFHLVLSSFTHAGVDIPLAQKILDWNLVRYPSGVFFLFGHGRIALLRAQSRQAIESYTRAMQAQDQYANLHHISLWEIALARLALWEVTESVACWKRLEEEATWSKAVYVYGCAVCLLQIGEEGGEGSEKVKQEAKKYLEKVPKSLQRIAGKSIPMEVGFASSMIRGAMCNSLNLCAEIRCPQSPQIHLPA
jgi:tetratricopeptide (TPR) repeat protein